MYTYLHERLRMYWLNSKSNIKNKEKEEICIICYKSDWNVLFEIQLTYKQVSEFLINPNWNIFDNSISNYEQYRVLTCMQSFINDINEKYNNARSELK